MELWKEVGENKLNELFKLIRDIYRTTDLPKSFVKSTIIFVLKKIAAKNVNNIAP